MPHLLQPLLLASVLWALLPLSRAIACDGDATPVFSCEAGGGKKYIELCAVLPVTAESGYLEYRFGSQENSGFSQPPDLVFPTSRKDSLRHFFGATYSNAGTYTQSIRFETGQASYTVFTEARGSVTTRAGVTVRPKHGTKVITVACNERPRFYIHEFKGLLACDSATPVGKACIE